MAAPKKYPSEVRDRAVRMVNEKLTAEPSLVVSTVCRLVVDQIGINKNGTDARIGDIILRPWPIKVCFG